MSRVEVCTRPELTPLASHENALAAYTKTPPRNIVIDPSSARTVVHEIHAQHRRTLKSDGSQNSDHLRTPPQMEMTGTDGNREVEVLPERHHYTPPRGSKSRRQRRTYDTELDTDSDSDGHLKPQISRRRRPSNSDRRRSSNENQGCNRPPLGRRHSGERARHDDRRDLVLVPKPQSPSSHHHSESDSGYDSEAHEREKRATRNQKILYTGLAGLTTVTAANCIYQNAKAFHDRRNAMKETADMGELEDEEERRKRRNKHLMTDAFALLVVGVGVNNVRVGWQRREEKKKAHEAAEQKVFERFERRERGAKRDRAYSVEEV